jgi:hypothetical protein
MIVRQCLLVELQPLQTALLERVCAGPLIEAAALAGVITESPDKGRRRVRSEQHELL